MIINIENLHFSYGIHEIFKDLNLSINEKKQIGLVGRNGTGKSTLLKLLTGELTPDSGRISKKNGLTIGVGILGSIAGQCGEFYSGGGGRIPRQ